ncbi:ATPase family AAA domain-containing protein 5 [Araneus ventricosus]|uniref:ATPase family AAA domain-containing protein 5 n=1 Tax=Araneus ventricosus TaxID=182803 RepID=A0A4Y2CQT0_ARAVE|nr:ATPase family AAA domain-containing protein 5 [Araneus ventricosus]
MAAVEVGSECGKLRSSARISNVKSYSENYEKLDEFLDMDEASPKNLRPKKRVKLSAKKKGKVVPCEIPEDLTKDLRPKKRAKKRDKLVPSEIPEISTKEMRPQKRAKMSTKKKDKLVSCEAPVGEIKTNVISNAEKKFFPIFTSSPKLRIQQILSPGKISINTEPKIELAEKSSQNHNDVYQTKINKINGTECNEHVLSPVKKQKEVAGDVEEDSKVISGITTAICINRILVKNEEVLETDQMLIEPDNINTENNQRQDSCKKVKETPITNGNCSDFINTSSEGDKLMPLKKKKNVKGNTGRSNSFFKIKSECKILKKGDPNTTAESKSPEVNNEMNIKMTKPAGALKLFPIFSSSHSLVKTSKSSPEGKEKNKLFNEITDCVQQTKQLSDDVTDDVQTEQLSNDITDGMQAEQLSDDVTDGMQTEQLSDDITDGMQSEQLCNDFTDCVQTKVLSNDSTDYVQTEQPSIMKDNALATSHEPSIEIIVDESMKVVDRNPVSVIHPVRTHRKRKLNKSDDSAAVSSMRVTRSQKIKSNNNTSHIATSLSCTNSDNAATKKCTSVKKKLQRNKTKTDALKLLPQSRQCFKKKKDDADLKKINPTKLFPLFSKSQIAVVEKKSISQLNSSAKKRTKNNAKTPKSSRASVAHDSVDDLFEENNSNDEKIQTKNNRKMKNNSKVLKKKISDLETLEISDDSIVEITDTDDLKVEAKIVKQSESADLESMNKTETLEEKNTATMPRKKGNNVSSKAPEMCLSFPLITQCYALDKEFDSSVSKYFLKEDDITNEINIPLWNKMVGLTDIKSTDEADMVSPTQNINEITQIEHIYETNDILWTDISNDYNLKEGVSESTISDLNLWLSQWKSRFTKNDKSKHNDSDDSFDSFSSDSNDSEAEGLSNSIIIMGPPGCGKTSLVFSLANDHGFKVLEVNASSCRNGRNISHQLKEALESYHVENIKTAGVNFQKETYEEYDEDDALTKPKKNKIAKKDIADYLQKGKKSVEGETVKKKSTMKNFFQLKSVTKNSDENQKLKKTVSKQHQSTAACPNDSSFPSTSRSISTRTIILFDDIDVVFQEDEGLWSTIRNFLKISKKPVIFTVSRNLAVVKANLDSDIRVLYLKQMVEEVAIEKINGQYEKYSRKNSNLNMKLLINNSRDVRRNLLHAQFWSQPCDLHTSIESSEVFSTNTFFLGSLNFNAVDFILLILKNKFPNSYSMISEYHKIGYDLLHSNLFTILNGTDASNIVRSWQSVTKRTSKHDCDSIESLDTKHEYGIGESDLWKEACKIFELKKQRLQEGSSSEDLFIFSNVLEHFSFTDSLKGCFYKNMKWISQPERNRIWSLGLPACSEESEFCSDSCILDMVSLIQMLGLQLAQNKYSSSTEFKNDDNKMLVLEHPFMNCDDENEVKVDAQLKSIASEFSASHMLNKTAFNLDYLSTLKIICREELSRRTKSGKRSNRFLHYFDSISLYIDKSQIEKCVE